MKSTILIIGISAMFVARMVSLEMDAPYGHLFFLSFCLLVIGTAAKIFEKRQQ